MMNHRAEPARTMLWKKIIVAVFALAVQCFCIGARAQFTQSASFDDHVRSSFKQGQKNDGNCAAIAVIKASIATFGPETLASGGHENTFKADTETASGRLITLRNGETVSLSQMEIDQAARESDFTIPISADAKGDQVIMKRANYLYAVLAQRAMTFRNDRSKPFRSATSFSAALKMLKEGSIDSNELAVLLGLTAQPVPPNTHLSYVHANFKHAVFATMLTYDEYGTSEDMTQFEPIHHVKNPLSRHKHERTNFILVDQVAAITVATDADHAGYLSSVGRRDSE